ncbi:MAG: hypothetical protein RSB82_00625 [Victivallaceae bacterium]
MKKWFFLIAICLCSVSFASSIQERKIDPQAFSELTFALNIPKDEDIIAATQRMWLRKPNQERWDVKELSEDQRLFVLDWAKKQGFFSSWKPLDKSYDKAFILGATTSRMSMRLKYLKQLWENEGVRFNEVVWLTGDRPLDPRVDDLTECCNNESQAACVIWKEAHLPKEMHKLPVVFVSAPMKVNGDVLKRPNTEDTIIAWLERDPKPCKAIFVSNQPFCGYQFAVIDKNLPKEFLFDVVGHGTKTTSDPALAAVVLDSIARWIYLNGLNAKS